MAGPLRTGGARALVLIGFMGAGKSTAAREAADRLGIDAVDVDEEIEARAGRSIAEIFRSEGEGPFRALEERIALETLNLSGRRVIALGGGAVSSPAIRQALAGHLVAWIDVDPAVAWARCSDGSRPLAADRAAFLRLHQQREPLYAQLAQVTIPAARNRNLSEILDALAGLPEGAEMIWAASASGDYPAYIGEQLLADGFWPQGIPGRRFLVTDGQVGRLYGDALEPLAGRVAIMPGEQSKTVAHAEIVWTELVRAGMTRGDLVVALGGGVVGDLGGFCAATYQRGVRYVQVPTTLVAQVDSAYGGKTGVDLAEAKNYVGAYHQPSAVIADLRTLDSLPEAELAAGYAEVVKTALIAGGYLWDAVRAGAPPTARAVIAGCARTKLRIVAADERDAGVRQVLNLGHTVGHAIETATGYARFRHGEAVALGLLAALRLSGQDELRTEVLELLAARGLPVRLEDVDPERILSATAKDKKRVGEGPVPFVLLDGPGRPRPGSPVAASELVLALRELAA